MTELEGDIKFWESILKNQRFVMAISTIAIVESTIKCLKQLREVKEVNNEGRTEKGRL